jgi:hypothetical protein
MVSFRAALAVGVLVFATAGPASAARSDLSGVWSPVGRNLLGFAANARGGGGPAVGGERGAPGEGRRGGGGGPGQRESAAPYNAEWAARYRRMMDASRAGKVTLDPTARCLPPGMPRAMSTIFPFEISVEPNRVLVLFEIGGVRWIWTDGRKHPSDDDLQTTFMGDSVGHWEGDTLVVDTVGLRGDTVFDASGAPHSDKLHVVERIRVTGPDRLEDRMTIEDPVAFAHPWEDVQVYDRKRDWGIMEYVCEENNRGVDPNDPEPGK